MSVEEYRAMLPTLSFGQRCVAQAQYAAGYIAGYAYGFALGIARAIRSA